jgi:glycosyltransferase involved in cell wall biosynthesis
MYTLNNLSAIIITHRAGNALNKTIESVRFAKKIILLDYSHNLNLQGSFSDSQIKVIKHQPPLTNFALARNQALTCVKTKWVLYIDSDEIFNPACFNQLKSFISDHTINGIYIKRKDIFFNKVLNYGEVLNVSLLRIAKKNKIRWYKPVHELAKVRGKTTHSKIIFYHHAHTSLSNFFKKIIFYSSINAKNKTQNLPVVILSLIFFPIGKFVYTYIIKLGFLDGWRGLIYSFMMSLHSLFVRIFQYENMLKA